MKMMDLPIEARRAIKNKGNWEGYKHDTTEGMIYCPHFDDDEWMKLWVGIDIYVEEGMLLCTEVTCDGEGDWDHSGEDYTLKGYDAALEQMYKEGAEHYDQYMQHCLDTGEDPLDEIMCWDLTKKERQTWQIYWARTIERTLIKGWRRGGRGPWLTSRKAMPQILADYLDVEFNPRTHLWLTRDSYDFKELFHSSNKPLVQMEVGIPPRDKALKARIRKVARSHFTSKKGVV